MGGKTPKPVAMPTNNDAAVQAAADEARRRALSGGQAATVLTSGAGITTTADKTKPTLGT